MNSTFNSLKLAAFACALALLGLGAAGCTDHGPVGIYSKELFNKNILPPHLDFAVASGISFTACGGSSGTGSGAVNTAGGTLAEIVSIVNNGGSSTYGPILVTFSNTDPHFHFLSLTITPQLPQAVCQNGVGLELPANGATFTLERGYGSNGADYVVDVTNSFEFWYDNMACNGGNTVIPEQILMQIQDGIGDTWNTSFTLYIDM
jgi:hypothetical protein